MNANILHTDKHKINAIFECVVESELAELSFSEDMVTGLRTAQKSVKYITFKTEGRRYY